jgi:F-type H+-transporting ATPase subunit b
MRLVILSCVLALGGLAGGSVAAFAASAPAQHDHAPAEAARPAGEGHTAGAAHVPEQATKDIFGKSLDLAIWTMVVFLLLVFILTRFAWKPMLQGLQRREQAIHQALADAEKAREETQRLQEYLKREMDNAGAKVREILEEARRDAQATADEMLAKARAEIQTERDRLRREMDIARDQALQELWSQTAQLATLVSAKAIRRQLSPEDHRRLVDEALADLRRAGVDRSREVASVQG